MHGFHTQSGGRGEAGTKLAEFSNKEVEAVLNFIN